MIAPPQSIPVSARTVLVDVAVARAALGCDSDRIAAMIDGPTALELSWGDTGLRWAWDVSARGRGDVREIRLWVRELIAPEFCRHLEPEQAIDMVLGSVQQWHRSQAAQLLMISRPTLKRLIDTRELAGGPLFVPRTALADFLQRRLLSTSVSR